MHCPWEATGVPHWCPKIVLLTPTKEITSPEQQPLLCLLQIHCHRNCSLQDAPTHSTASVNRARGEGEVRQPRLYPVKGEGSAPPWGSVCLQGTFKGPVCIAAETLSVCLFAQEGCCKNEKNIYIYTSNSQILL